MENNQSFYPEKISRRNFLRDGLVGASAILFPMTGLEAQLGDIKPKNKNPNAKISYDLPKDSKIGSSLIIEKDGQGYKIIKRKEYEFVLNYDTEKSRFFINGAQQIDNLEIGSFQSAKTYLFLGENVPSGFDKAAIQLGKGNNPDFKLYSPAGNKGFSVKLLPSTNENGNKKYGGIDVKEKDNLIFLTMGEVDTRTGKKIDGNSEILIQNRDKDFPLINTKGGFMIINGKKMIRYNEHSGGVMERNLEEPLKVKKIGTDVEIPFDFKDSNAVPMQIHVKDKDGIDLKYKNGKESGEEVMDIFVINKDNEK